jgi:hypothetical protein
MFLLQHVEPEGATGKVKEAYSVFPKEFPVPTPLVLMSASPDLAHLQSGIIRHFMTHPKLDMGLLATIRYMVANEVNYPFCINLNAGILKMAGGMSDAELQAMKADPEKAPLEDFQKALVRFVLKVIRTPEKVEKADIDHLHELGWADQDIFDAAYHGAAMVTASTLYKAFIK